MGEANYVLRRFPQAIENFKRVISQYPNSPKLADALLKIGFSQYELQAWPEARQTLEDLVNRYPTSTAGQLGNNRLHQMKVEGR
jgi:TolA-binding protein